MSHSDPIYLNELAIINALGAGKEEVLANLLQGVSPGMADYSSPIMGKSFFVGQVLNDLPIIPEKYKSYNCRNNQLALAVIQQIEPQILEAKKRYGSTRIGIVMGSSTSGILEAEQAFKVFDDKGSFPKDYCYKKQEIGAVTEFMAKYLEIKGPAYSVLTACSSSGKVFASARGLIEMGICDLVITGGVDSLCEMTLRGFESLEAVSSETCNPFSVNRKGINIGEAAALFMMSREESPVALLGVGESSDAHHMSAPEPSGAGAQAAMRAALVDASLEPSEIDYINLHGTATQLNDAAESHAVYALFKNNTLASSTKPLTGHTLGAAGATEAGIGWLLLNKRGHYFLPANHFDGQLDPILCKINLCNSGTNVTVLNTVMSNSFAFGGNNVSVILGRNTNV
ncbi:MAG: beta-ketoacyl-[acyl-carrier-protein] synthase family protein [Gammaproteobacteria bacterium]|nr:beta-ketoacyl-[acyl-carrier-protein] synthase family protein [Gammaproteobacteria bacterium]